MAGKRKGYDELKPVLVAMHGDNVEFGQRLSWVIDRCGGLTKAAKLAGTTTDTLANWREGRTKPNLFGVVPLCGVAGVSLDWLVGCGPGIQAERSLDEAIDFSYRLSDGEFSLVPYLPEVEETPWFGLLPGDGYCAAIAFRSEWLRKLGLGNDKVRAFIVRDDSMEPTIKQGDTLIIDTSFNRARDNGIYVVSFSGNILVKRVSLRRDGGIALVSDRGGDLYPTEVIPPGDATSFAVVGRVAWLGREV